MSDRAASLRRRYYPSYDPFPLNILVLSHVKAGRTRVLEIGCGDGRNSPALRGLTTLWAGVDPDLRVLENPNLDQADVGVAEHLPWPDQSFDLAFHRVVAEHFVDPAATMRETARVLRPDGLLLFETPSRWYYPMIVAAVTPHWFHEFWVSLIDRERKHEDVFPTFYRCNSRHQISAALAEAGLRGEIRLTSTPPNYLSLHPAAFMAGILYERTFERLVPALRGKIIVEAQKR